MKVGDLQEKVMDKIESDIQEKTDAVNRLINPLSPWDLNVWVFAFETVLETLKKHPAYKEGTVHCLGLLFKSETTILSVADLMEALQKERSTHENSEDNL